MHQFGVLYIGEVLHAERTLGSGHALLGQVDLLALFLYLVIVLAEPLYELVGFFIQIRALVPGARYDERRPRFVYEYAVHLVDYGVVELTLNEIVPVYDHVVSQVVESELVVRGVGYIAGIGSLLLLLGHLSRDQADCIAEEAVDLTHPLAVALCQVFVDCDYMHALAGYGIKDNGERCHERFTFARLHLRDVALVQDYAADYLNRVVLKSDDSP